MQQRLSSDPVATVETMSEVSLGVWVSFAEIYNEHIYDLLLPDPQRGKQRDKLQLGSSNNQSYIKNLTVISVSSGLEAYQVLQFGLRNLNYAATCVNARSSRSHCIFTIKLVQAPIHEEGYSISYFNFCDLAGSERVKKTLNVGDRLKESNNINTSLLVLGRCISAVRDSQNKQDHRLIPFRESKLTQLFKRALSGLEDISMIVNISPSRSMFEESQHVLNFSAIAKEIAIERPKVEKKRNSFFAYMQGGRSTSYAPIPEESEEHTDAQNIIAQLLLENDQLKQEAIEVEENARLEVIHGYREIMKTREESYRRELEELKRENEYQLEKLKQKYENNSKVQEIIILDSSSDEDLDQLNGIEGVIAEKDREIAQLVSEHETEISCLNSEVKELKQQNKDLKQTLDDAAINYKSLENRVNELLKEKEYLQDQLVYAEALVSLRASEEEEETDLERLRVSF